MPTVATHHFTGQPVQFVVPAGVTSIQVDMQGASGGGFLDINRRNGGRGGRVRGVYPVTPGEVLWLYVGGRGDDQSGWNGGGPAPIGGSGQSQIGGGATDVRRGGQGLQNRFVVAAGGGAASAVGVAGGNGGHPNGAFGATGFPNRVGGAGGTQTAGGDNDPSTTNVNEGRLGFGGTGGGDNASGGGGGGYYGGAAGFYGGPNEQGGGGGGGSSYSSLGGADFLAATDGSGQLTLTYNQPPSAPPLFAPVNDESINRERTNRFSWQHSDPDGDGQSRFTMRYRQIGAPAWLLHDFAIPVQYAEFVPGFFATGSYEWQVRTYDTSGAQGSFSASAFFRAVTAPPGPAITAPVNGSTIGTPTAVATWTGTGTSWELRTVAEVNGVADPSQVFYVSGEQQVVSVGRRWTFPLEVNSRRERLQIREKKDGLFGDWSDVGYLVSYTLPAAPTGTLKIGTFAMLVTASNPTPDASQPAVTYNELERGLVQPDGSVVSQGFLRDLGKPGRQRLQVPLSAEAVDGTVVSGTSYGYRFHAIAMNGTRRPGPWITTPVDVIGPDGPVAEGFFANDFFDPAYFE